MICCCLVVRGVSIVQTLPAQTDRQWTKRWTGLWLTPCSQLLPMRTLMTKVFQTRGQRTEITWRVEGTGTERRPCTSSSGRNDLEWFEMFGMEKAKSVGIERTKWRSPFAERADHVYGLKGMAAYLGTCVRLGYDDESIHTFMQSALAQMTTKPMSADELIVSVMKTGEIGVQTMALLRQSQHREHGNPGDYESQPSVGKNPGILISGHDLQWHEDCWNRRKVQAWMFIRVGEMLPAH